MTEPERQPRRYRREEKEEEKQDEKEEKTRGEKSVDEKWRHDPINAICWAAIFIWAGLILLGDTTHWGTDTFFWWSTWALIMTGAGAIFLLSAAARLVMPEYRRPIVGNVVLGTIFLGVGLGDMTGWGWTTIGAVVLIVVGLAIILGGIFRRRR